MHHTEIINSCTNEAVAEAALLSLGGDFCARVQLLAGTHQLSAGRYVAALVYRFAEEAEDHSWSNLDAAMQRQDMPLLAGLRFVLETMIDGEESAWENVARRRARAKAKRAEDGLADCRC